MLRLATMKERKLYNIKPNRKLLIYQKENIEGYAIVRIDREKSKIDLERIEVLDGYKNRGIGGLILDSIRDYARANNIYNMEVSLDIKDDDEIVLFFMNNGMQASRLVMEMAI